MASMHMTEPAPSSCAPCPTSQESMWPPITTISSGFSRPRSSAITFAETGHLCLGTLHANNANQALERIMNFFRTERHAQIHLQLSMNLRAIVSQRLIASTEGKRVAACEILLDTPRIKDLIKKGDTDLIKEAMEQGVQEGCQTFDHVLFLLYRDGKITLEQALANADSMNNLRLKIKLAGLKDDDPEDGGTLSPEKQPPPALQMRLSAQPHANPTKLGLASPKH